MILNPIPRQEAKLFSTVAGIYFNIIMPGEGLENKISKIGNTPQKIGKDFLLERVEKVGNDFTLHLITYKRKTSEFPPDLEDYLRTILPNEGIHLSSRKGFLVEEVGRRAFFKKALELEAILGRKLEYGVGDILKIEEYTTDLVELAKVMRASDIHIFPNPVDRGESGLVQFRIDGKLRDIERLNSNNLKRLLDYISKLEKRSDSEDARAYEGGFYIGKDTETKYRTSFLQITTGFSTKEGFGEGIKNKSYSLVIRLLKTEDIDPSLDKLGYLPEDVEKVQNLIKERSGFILFTGATCMGKTTTIGSIVNESAKQCKGEKKIVTLEDPVEYHLKGALQFPVTMDENNKEQLTYRLALEYCLRQDPDVIVIGEARDAETVKDMVDAAQTGHLILATIHSKDPISALTRLAGHGIQGPAMNDSLLGVISQMLIGKNCPQCKETRQLTSEEANYFFHLPNEDKERYKMLEKDFPNIMEEYETLMKENIKKIWIAESTGEYQGGVCPKCEGLKFYGRMPIVQIYIHKTEHSPIISSICNGDPDGPTRMKELFMKGVHQPFALNALRNLFLLNTSPRQVMDNLPPSYFGDYNHLLIKETNKLVKIEEDQAKKQLI